MNMKHFSQLALPTLEIKKLNDKAIIPTKGSPESAGYDLYSVEEPYTLKPLERKLFKTGLAMAIPNSALGQGMYGRIAPRSGLAFKQGLDVMAGVIDADYRNELGVVLINLSDKDITVPVVKDGKPTAIAQIIFECYNNVQIQTVAELDSTERGQGGFGSTDVKKEVKKEVKDGIETPRVHAPKEADTLIQKWKDAGAEVPAPPKYETIIREREKHVA